MSATRLSVLAAAVAATTLVSAPDALHAQSAQKFSIQASGLYVSAFGKAYEGLEAGPGGEVQVRYTPGVWSIGVGAQVSTHSFSEPSLDGTDVTLAGGFIEPRRIFDVGSATFAPYASARLAFLRQSVDIDLGSNSVSASASGTQINAGGGVLLRVSPRVNVDLGATYGVINFGDVKVTIPGYGSATTGSTGSGQNLVLRAGIAIGL